MPNQLVNGNRYGGPAPEPERSISLAGGDAFMEETHYVDPSGLTPGIDRNSPRFGVSEPPDNGDLASQFAKLDQRMGELINGLGEQKKFYERQIKEQDIRHRAELASLRPSGPNVAAPTMDGDQDEGEAPVSARTLLEFGRVMGIQTQAYVTRALLGMTAEEEALILRQYPTLQNTPEPMKSELLRDALALLRESAAPKETPTGSDAPKTTPSVNAPNVRSAQRMVPQPERPTEDFSAEEPRVEDRVAAANRKYEEARRIPDKKQRFAAMKSAMIEAAAAQGISHEALSKSGWIQS
jgi:hypothetical protein